MKKTLVALGLTTALSLPMGLTVAAAQDDLGTDTPTTLVDQTRDRDRLQVHDCTYRTDADQLQTRVRAHRHVNDVSVVSDVVDGTVRPDETVPDQVDDSVVVDNVEGERVLDGTGPLHDGPHDGTGNQYGNLR